jgi:hypothetical protein
MRERHKDTQESSLLACLLLGLRLEWVAVVAASRAFLVDTTFRRAEIGSGGGMDSMCGGTRAGTARSFTTVGYALPFMINDDG